MADSVGAYALGRINEWTAAGATMGALFLTTSQSHALLKDHATVAAMFAAGGGTANVECAASGYSRQALTSITGGSPTIGSDPNVYYSDCGDLTFGAVAASAAITKLIIFKSTATIGSADNANQIIASIHDYPETPTGAVLVALVNNFFSATN